MQPTKEKRIHDVKLRLTDSEYLAACKLAEQDDRTLGDFLHLLLFQSLYGLAYKVDPATEQGNGSLRGG